MRSMPSEAQGAIWLPSCTAKCFSAPRQLLTSLPIQLPASTLRETTIPFWLTIVTMLPAGNPCIRSALLETFEPGSRCQDGNESTGAILERARDADDPASALISTPHVTDRELPAGQDLREERAVCGIDVSRSRCPDIGSIEGKYADMSDVVWQLALDLPSSASFVAMSLGSIGERLVQPDQKVLEIADVVVDLAGKNASFVDGLLNRRRLIALPLAPETAPDQGGERNHGGDHRGQKPRSNAPQQPSLPAAQICLPIKRLLRSRGRPNQLPIRRLSTIA
jgi:hypothetical protein